MSAKIQIVGPLRSGKSTLAVLIEEALRNLGFEVEVKDIDLPELKHRVKHRFMIGQHMDDIRRSLGKVEIGVIQTKRRATRGPVCPNCEGSGRDSCPLCNGTGRAFPEESE